jgi:hypothetical protein
VVVDAEPAWHRAADLAVALGVDVWDTSDAEGKMCFIFPIRQPYVWAKTAFFSTV